MDGECGCFIRYSRSFSHVVTGLRDTERFLQHNCYRPLVEQVVGSWKLEAGSMLLNKALFKIKPHTAVGVLATVRWNWQGFLTQRFDRASGQYKFDDWEKLMLGSQEPTKAGKSLLQRHLNNEEHIKPKEIKRRTTSRVLYDRKIKRIEDLTKYIQFMKDHPDDFKSGRKQ